MLKWVKILPTGNEVMTGIIQDSNSVSLLELIIKEYPRCRVDRLEPVNDDREEISRKLSLMIKDEPQLVFTIGGTGGGRKFVPSLARDETSGSVEKTLERYDSVELRGINGHIFARIVAGYKNDTLVVTLPGPAKEAVAAAEKVISLYRKTEMPDYEEAVKLAAKAVEETYPKQNGR